MNEKHVTSMLGKIIVMFSVIIEQPYIYPKDPKRFINRRCLLSVNKVVELGGMI